MAWRIRGVALLSQKLSRSHAGLGRSLKSRPITFQRYFSRDVNAISRARVTLNALTQQYLPQRLYRRLANSSLAQRLARNSIWVFLGASASRLLNLITMILVARALGQATFGELGLLTQTLAVLGAHGRLGPWWNSHTLCCPILTTRQNSCRSSNCIGHLLFWLDHCYQ